MLSKLAYLTLCRSIQPGALVGRWLILEPLIRPR